ASWPFRKEKSSRAPCAKAVGGCPDHRVPPPSSVFQEALWNQRSSRYESIRTASERNERVAALLATFRKIARSRPEVLSQSPQNQSVRGGVGIAMHSGDRRTLAAMPAKSFGKERCSGSLGTRTESSSST